MEHSPLHQIITVGSPQAPMARLLLMHFPPTHGGQVNFVYTTFFDWKLTRKLGPAGGSVSFLKAGMFKYHFLKIIKL